MLFSVLGFLAILGPLVVVHELGHFLFARLFNVKAEVFSIGFGPKLWARQVGETEWRLAAIPLGGYVKLLGEEGETELKPEDMNRTLQKQAPWKRFFIFFGGPLFNFIFAVFVFMAILVIGEQQTASVVGRVVVDSAAERAGFRSGDRILTVDGKQVRKWEEVQLVIHESPEKQVRFGLERSGQPLELTVAPTVQHGLSIYGEHTNVGEIDGLFAMPRAGTIGVSDPGSPAAKAGLKTGDTIVSLNGTPIKNWEQLEADFKALPNGTAVSLELEGSDKRKSGLKFSKTTGGLAEQGIHSSELFIEKVVEKSPAEAAGVRPGDRIVSVAGKELLSFFQLKDGVQSSGEKDGKVKVIWEREGKRLEAQIVPTATTTRDPALKKSTQFTIGIMPQLVWAEPVTFIERTLNPFLLVGRAVQRMVIFSWRNVVSIGKMFTGSVSVNTLGGPILIGKLAGESMQRGLISFLTMMAILSVGLGILNVLPVPVLDGGHLLLLAIEMVRGKPLTLRQMEIVQQVGLSLILLLMAVVMKNDVVRLMN